MKGRNAGLYETFVKRILDVVFSTLMLLVVSPVMLLTAVAIKLGQRSDVFFIQERPGKEGKMFKLIKFKTMTDERDEDGMLLPDEDRLTPTGNFVRATSLDELPQLINVLKGDMSFVGPRPLLVKYLPRYNDFQRRRHEVRPGITGWAQVNGRNAISWDERFALDVWYVDHVSFWTDLRIVVRTVGQVLRRKGISSATSATMETFQGNG